ncbi:MAG: amidohydrolase family protein, partial [Chloroflexi bacterium]|nr:amidohydrolase family protein [Chloroflexota bacterium]
GVISSIDADVDADADTAAGQVVEGQGLWAVPGLIDTHIHLALTGQGTLPLNLALGVTTVRDLGSDLTFLREQRRKQEAGAGGARLLYTGPMIDGPEATWPALVSTTADAEEAAHAVEERIEAGADAIKLYTTLELESLRRCIKQADGRLPVTGHLGRTLASEAMRAGINGLEHALLTPYNDLVPEDHRTSRDELMLTPGFWQKVNAGWVAADLTADHAKRWIDLLVERDVSFCPTLTVLPGADAPDEDAYDHLPSYRKMREERMRLAGRQAPVLTEEIRERLRPVREKLQELVRRVHQAGGRVIAGTDTGAVGVVPGFSLHMELGFLSGAGLSNMDVILAATSRAAEALWRDDLGTVQPGKRADILLLRADPLADLAALRDIQHVIQDGRVHDPADLFAEARGNTG